MFHLSETEDRIISDEEFHSGWDQLHESAALDEKDIDLDYFTNSHYIPTP